MAAAARFEDFAIAVSTDGGATIVALRGELDLSTGGQLRSALQGLHADGVLEIVVDCARLSFMDSSGLGVLLAASRRFRDSGGRLVVRRPTKPVARIIEVTGAERELSVEP